MHFLEKEIEQIIFDAENNDLCNQGLIVYGKKYRQIKIGNYGIADLLIISRMKKDFNINLIELKQKEINVSTFIQAIRYLKGIKHFIDKNKNKYKNICNSKFYFEITLIGKSINLNSDFVYLNSIINFHELELKFYTYHLEIKGLKFKRIEEYFLINPGF